MMNISESVRTMAKASSNPSSGLVLQRKCACGGSAGFSGECEACKSNKLLGRPLQRKLAISEPGDRYEQEADRIADQVMAMPRSDAVTATPVKVQRFTGSPSGQVTEVPVSVERVLASPGQPLEPGLCANMEARFGHEFSRVRVHTGTAAKQSAWDVNAYAYTVGQDIVLGSDQFSLETQTGEWLLAHELTHVLQQSSLFSSSTQNKTRLKVDPRMHYERQTSETADQKVQSNSVTPRTRPPVASSQTVQRVPIGSRVVHPTGTRSPYRRVQAEFDGREFSASGDGGEFLRVNAQSGRPIAVRESEVRSCGGELTDTYMNNARYVGIEDNGPIPEGEYRFRVNEMATFSEEERYEMLRGGHYTDPFDRALHGGDWGSGRVPLHSQRIIPSSISGCGETSTRSGFFLHGGIMPGSSGCIDIGNSGFDDLVRFLLGYTGQVQVTVRYRHAATLVGPVERVLGGVTYTDEEEPSVWSRIWSGVDQYTLERMRRQMACMERCEERGIRGSAFCQVSCLDPWSIRDVEEAGSD